MSVLIPTLHWFSNFCWCWSSSRCFLILRYVAREIDVTNSSLSVCTLVSAYSLLLVLVPVHKLCIDWAGRAWECVSNRCSYKNRMCSQTEKRTFQLTRWLCCACQGRVCSWFDTNGVVWVVSCFRVSFLDGSRFWLVLLACLLLSVLFGNFPLANGTSEVRRREFTNE